MSKRSRALVALCKSSDTQHEENKRPPKRQTCQPPLESSEKCLLWLKSLPDPASIPRFRNSVTVHKAQNVKRSLKFETLETEHVSLVTRPKNKKLVTPDNNYLVNPDANNNKKEFQKVPGTETNVTPTDIPKALEGKFKKRLIFPSAQSVNKQGHGGFTCENALMENTELPLVTPDGNPMISPGQASDKVEDTAQNVDQGPGGLSCENDLMENTVLPLVTPDGNPLISPRQASVEVEDTAQNVDQGPGGLSCENDLMENTVLPLVTPDGNSMLSPRQASVEVEDSEPFAILIDRPKSLDASVHSLLCTGRESTELETDISVNGSKSIVSQIFDENGVLIGDRDLANIDSSMIIALPSEVSNQQDGYNFGPHAVSPDNDFNFEVFLDSPPPVEAADMPLSPGLPETHENIDALNPECHQPANKRTRRNRNVEATPVKKRKLQPELWKVNIAKAAQNAGLAHTSLRGKEIKARSMGPGCSATCARKCQGKISLEKRQILFKRFWDLKDHSRQWDFLMRYVNVLPVKQRKVPVDDLAQPWRNRSFQYNLYDSETMAPIVVCQKMFLDTFNVSITFVKTAVKKMIASEGKISPDKRGKVKKRSVASTLMRANVKAHISSFPTVESHYCRKRTQKKYLDQHLSVAKMHRMYKAERGDQPHTATLHLYQDIFNQDFNLSFFTPRKDQCSICLVYKNKDNKSEEDIKRYNDHITAKNRAQELKRKDVEESRAGLSEQVAGAVIEDIRPLRVISFDLQKVLECPKGENSEFFYRRKLSCFNFTIFDATTKEGFCYVWDQTVAKRGSNEINSCLLDFIDKKSKQGVKEIRCYSDNCSGQNKNKNLFSMYCMAALKYQMKITHTWLQKGHTQMECDSMHARIEHKTKRMDIFTPSQWYNSMRTAKVQQPFYQVQELTRGIVLNFKKLQEDHFKSWSSVPTKSIRRLVVSNETPGIVIFFTEYDGQGKAVNVMPKTRGRPVVWANYALQPAYSGRIPLKPALLKDLKWYVQKGYIPPSDVPFYVSLPNWSPNYVLEHTEAATGADADLTDGSCSSCDE